MTRVDGLTLPVRVAIAGDAFDHACDYARQHGLTISEAASQMLRTHAHTVETRATLPSTPVDGREGPVSPSTAPSVLTLAESKALHPAYRSGVPVNYVPHCTCADCGELGHEECS